MKTMVFSTLLAALAVAASSAEACTSWVLRPEVTESGRMIVQKILDDPYRPLPMDAAMHVAPNGWRWIRVGRNGGPSMAMNEKGVALTTNCGDSNGSGHPGGDRHVFNSWSLQWVVMKNCASAAEGVEMIKNIGRNKLFSYRPGVDLGTILLIADAKRAFLIEIGYGYCEAVEVGCGMHVVANGWTIPGYETVSKASFPIARGNRAREACAAQALRDNRVNGKYTVRGCFDASRKIRGRKFKDRYPFVAGNRKSSNLSLTTTCFEIDPEFPAHLSCAYVSLGPQRHTMYLPIPMAVKQLPDKMRDGRWSKMVFDHQEAVGPEHDDLKKFTDLEAKQLKEFSSTRERARALLKAGKTDEAVKLLNDEFARQFAEADALMTRIHGERCPEAAKADGK